MMTIRHKHKRAGRRAVLILVAAVILACLVASCSTPSAVLLAFTANTAPTLTADSASVLYAWSFTNTSAVPTPDGFPVDVRLYRVTSTDTRVMAAKGVASLTTLSGSTPFTFSIDTTLASGQYFVEFAFADDVGPQVIRTPEATLP
ncbi:MAG: hypothetical protein JXM71_05335 [Spirochaetales bacterium]|nr:hypothetical protein [Spirochaetales bacterium]